MDHVKPVGHVLRAFCAISMLIAFVGSIWLGLEPIRPSLVRNAPWIAGCHALAAYLGVRSALQSTEDGAGAQVVTSLAVGVALLAVPLITGSGFEELFILYGFAPLSYMAALDVTLAITKSRR